MLTNKPITTTLPAVDLKRAIKFYQEKLGLKVVEEKEGMGATIEGGNGTKIFLYKRGATKADHTIASFEVDNIEEEVKELKGKGVVFEEYDMPNLKTANGIATMDKTKAAWFKDSEGNILALSQSG